MNDFKTAILAVVKDLVSAEDVNINKAIFTEVFGVSESRAYQIVNSALSQLRKQLEKQGISRAS